MSRRTITIECKGSRSVDYLSLVPFQGKLKTLDKVNYVKLKKGILDLGFSSPIHVWRNDGKDYILDGHQRIDTLTRMANEGYAIGNIPVVDVAADSLKQAKIKVLALTSQYGVMSEGGLKDFASDLDLDMKGLDKAFRFPDIDFSKLYDEGEEGLTDDDAVPEVTEPICQTGQIWKLGNHRLMCGDCTVKENVDKLMDGEKADMVFTDPPYGVSYSGGIQFTDQGVQKENRKKLENDSDVSIYRRAAPIISQYVDGPGYIWFAFSNAKDTIDAIDAIDAIGEIHALIIWNKTNATYGALNANYKQRHEPCLYIKTKGSTLRWGGSTTERTVWDMKRDPRNDLHPTQKPVELAERAISNHKAATVLDIFLGSGSTLIACEKTNRRCYGMEIDPRYCDVIIKRWEDFTGKKAINTNEQMFK